MVIAREWGWGWGTAPSRACARQQEVADVLQLRDVGFAVPTVLLHGLEDVSVLHIQGAGGIARSGTRGQHGGTPELHWWPRPHLLHRVLLGVVLELTVHDTPGTQLLRAVLDGGDGLPVLVPAARLHDGPSPLAVLFVLGTKATPSFAPPCSQKKVGASEREG